MKFVFEGKKKIFISIIFLIMLMCKNVGALKVLVLYVYIDYCREGKIPDLSQADTSYYQVHKIQLITKHHILLLGFAITT